MEIFVLRDGQQTGPFSEDTLQSLCKQGGLANHDMAWHKGLPGWLPLGEVLKPGSERPSAPPPAPTTSGVRSAPRKGATGKQIALLKYIGATFEESITKEDAALAISDAMENPRFGARFQKWAEEKLRLHPEVFQDEIDHRRANRVARYLERCQTEASEAVKDVTKAHVQVLVESLDKKNSTWERDPREALWDHLLPSISEHFPQLVQDGWKGRLKQGNTKVAAAITAGELETDTSTPGAFSAAMRGIVYGGAVLGLILGGMFLFNYKDPEPTPKPPATAANSPAKEKPATPVEKPAPAHPTTLPLIGVNPVEPAAAPEPKPNEGPNVAAVPAVPAVPPAGDAPAADPKMANNALAPAAPVNPAVALNAPPAPAPGSVPPAPAPAPAPAEPPPAEPAAPPPGFKNILTITKPVTVQLQFGKVTLNTGTRIRFIALEGTNVRVNFNNNVILVPAGATDVDPSALPPAPTAVALPTPVTPPAPAPATPPPAPKSSPLSDL